MIRSMTGFGQAELHVDGVRIQVDMKSVNHRYGETVFRMPREWLVYEDKLRKLVGERIKRGRIDVFITAERSGTTSSGAEIDWALAAAYKQAADELGKRLEISGQLTIAELLAIPGLVKVHDRLQTEQAIEQALVAAVVDAANHLVMMREMEGGHLLVDLRARLEVLQTLAAETSSIAPDAVNQYRNKLRQRLDDIISDSEVIIDDQRLITEVALMAERSNIDEEITRLYSHLTQFNVMLTACEPIGRKLDFLIQEMNREVNTIGSKAGQSELIKLVVDMKAELEKIREQVQNIE